MRKVISLLLVLALICASSVLVFADNPAEKDISNMGTRGKTTKYFYDNIGNRYKAVGQTTASGAYAYVSTTGSLYTYAAGDSANFNGIKVTVSVSATTTLTNYSTWNNLHDSQEFQKPTLSKVAEDNYTYTDYVMNLTASHSMSTDHGGSVSFVTFVNIP